MKLHEPTFGEEEVAAAVDVMRSTMVTQGEKVRELEKSFWPHGHCVASNSGSSANLLAIAALVRSGRINPGDEVIVSALSWSTTVWPLVQYGLVPVIVDCDPDTLNIDPVEVEKAVTGKTRAIMPVHVYGNPCDMEALASTGPMLIEDCCEAMGAPVGSWGEIATFSTYFSHHITTLEGGLTVTSDPDLADLMRVMRSHGWLRDSIHREQAATEYPHIDPKFLFVMDGYNLRLNEVQAAIGLVQLPKLGEFVARRREVHVALREIFDTKSYLRQQRISEVSSCFGFTLVVEDDAPVRAHGLRLHLEASGTETRPIICGNIALQPAMKRFPHRVVGDLPNATKIMRDGFSIGCHQGVTQADIDIVAEWAACLPL